MIRTAVLILVAATSCWGCYAGIKAQEATLKPAPGEVVGEATVKDAPSAPGVDATPKPPPGLRYFLTTPYLIIEEQPQGRWAARLELGVDRSREFAVQPHVILASSTATIEFHPNGTLKSFKLEQDTTKIPEAVVDALKSIQLKRIELEQAALDRKLKEAEEKAEEGKSALLRDGALPAINPEDRRVLVYRIVGSQISPMHVDTRVKVPEAEAVGALERTDGLSGLAMKIEGDMLELSGRNRALAQTDIRAMQFVRADNQAVSDEITRKLRGETKVRAGKLVVPVASLRSASVKRIAIGTVEVEVP